MEIELKKEAVEVITKIEEHGYEAYVVGGAVRDSILNMPFSEFDITTNASQEVLKEIFKEYKIKPYSNQTTIGFVYNHRYFEITSYIGTIEEDLRNRDFRMNAIAYHPIKGCIDPYGGLKDIDKKQIQSVLSPDDTIKQSPIRILRAIRFSIKYNFSIHPNLKHEMIHLANELEQVLKQNITKELNEILVSKTPSVYIREYKEVFFEIFPKLKDTYHFDQHSKWHHLDVFEHILSVMDHCKNDLTLRLAALFHDIMKPDCFVLDSNAIGHFPNHFTASSLYAREVMKELMYNKEMIQDVSHLVLFHDTPLCMDKKTILHFLHDFGIKHLDLFFELKRADIYSQSPDLNYRIEEMNQIENYTNQLITQGEVYSFNQLNIKIKHLNSLNIDTKEISKLQDRLVFAVIDEEVLNQKDDLLQFITEKLWINQK